MASRSELGNPCVADLAQKGVPQGKKRVAVTNNRTKLVVKRLMVDSLGTKAKRFVGGAQCRGIRALI